ncbi:MAG: glycine cleavage system protein GcvH [Chitinispirillaceae bacterium]|nr:glycine cleavage system protein GcvH [Chitinispirillaceae bacterium]
MVPADRKYAKTHEWVKIEGNLAVVGISDHAQDSLGDITFVDLPKPGAQVRGGSECAVIESVKAAGDLYSPVSGKIAEINESLETVPEKINTDPYGEGWIIKIKDFNAAEFDNLLDAAAYENFLESEA